MRKALVAAAIGMAALGATACGGDAGAGDGDLAAFCEADRVIESGDPFASGDPAEAEEVAERMQAALEDGRRTAPDEIADDVERIGEVFEGMLARLEQAGYDTTAVDPEELFAAAAARDAEFEPALGRVGAFTEDRCES